MIEDYEVNNNYENNIKDVNDSVVFYESYEKLFENYLT